MNFNEIEKINLFNIDILNITEKQLLNNLNEGILFTPNVDHIVKLQKDYELYLAYKKANWIVCDSKILYLISKLFKPSLKEAIPGSSFFKSFYKYHKNNFNISIFLLGAPRGVAQKAMDNINNIVGRNIVVGAYSPSFTFENNCVECENIIKMVDNSKATVLVVGVGGGKQEKWIAKYSNYFSSVKLFMGLGATINFEANDLKRAPVFIQKLALEWFYRFLNEPKRMFKRIFWDDIIIFKLLFYKLFRVYKNPFYNDDDTSC